MALKPEGHHRHRRRRREAPPCSGHRRSACAAARRTTTGPPPPPEAAAPATAAAAGQAAHRARGRDEVRARHLGRDQDRAHEGRGDRHRDQVAPGRQAARPRGGHRRASRRPASAGRASKSATPEGAGSTPATAKTRSAWAAKPAARRRRRRRRRSLAAAKPAAAKTSAAKSSASKQPAKKTAKSGGNAERPIARARPGDPRAGSTPRAKRAVDLEGQGRREAEGGTPKPAGVDAPSGSRPREDLNRRLAPGPLAGRPGWHVRPRPGQGRGMRPIPAPRIGDSHGLLRAISERERMRLDEFVTDFQVEDLFPADLENALGRTRQFVSYARFRRAGQGGPRDRRADRGRQALHARRRPRAGRSTSPRTRRSGCCASSARST